MTEITEAQIRQAMGTWEQGTAIYSKVVHETLSALDPRGKIWITDLVRKRYFVAEDAAVSTNSWIADILFKDSALKLRQHAVIVDGIVDNMVSIRDPQGLIDLARQIWSGTEGTMHLEHFLQIWTGYHVKVTEHDALFSNLEVSNAS